MRWGPQLFAKGTAFQEQSGRRLQGCEARAVFRREESPSSSLAEGCLAQSSLTVLAVPAQAQLCAHGLREPLMTAVLDVPGDAGSRSAAGGKPCKSCDKQL